MHIVFKKSFEKYAGAGYISRADAKDSAMTGAGAGVLSLLGKKRSLRRTGKAALIGSTGALALGEITDWIHRHRKPTLARRS